MCHLWVIIFHQNIKIIFHDKFKVQYQVIISSVFDEMNSDLID